MRHAIQLAVAGTVLLTAAIAAWSVGADPPDASESRRRIEEMSQADRDRLGRAYDEFRRMPAERQAEILALHRTVTEDAGLERTLLDYEKFLGSLDPAEREQLREQRDPNKRIDLIEGFVADRAPRGPRFVDGPTLHGPELDRAMEIVLDELDLPDSKEAAISEQDKLHLKHLAIMKEAVKKRSSRGPGRESWPDDDTVREILAMHPDVGFRERLRKEEASADRGRREWQQGFRRSVVEGLLARSLLAEWHIVAKEEIPPDVLKRAFEELPEKDREESADRSPGELVRAAIREVLVKHDGDIGKFAKEFVEASDIRREVDPFFARRRGGPFQFRGPDGGPGGPPGRPGDDRRGDGRRGGDHGSGDYRDGGRRGPGSGPGPDRRG